MKISRSNIQSIYAEYGVSPERAKHSLGVAKIAEKLARAHGVDPENAWLAGALHDIARDWSESKIRSYCLTQHIYLNSSEAANYLLIHGKVASDILPRELEIDKVDILNAIRHHTSGKADMETLEQIIYIADFVESHLEEPEYRQIVSEMGSSMPKAIRQINEQTFNRYNKQDYKFSQDFLENIDFYSKYQKN